MGPVIVAVATVLVSVLPSALTQGPDEWPETVFSIGEPHSDHEGEYEEFECQGEPQLALGVADYPGCGNFGGEHVHTGRLVFGFRSPGAGNHGPVPLTGELSARVAWGSHQETDLTCRWSMGTFETCYITTPTSPPTGETFEFTCGSIQGSVGGWAECFIAHGTPVS